MKKKEIKFKYEPYNPNPHHKAGTKHRFGDCVIRAICKATGLDWFTVYDALCAKGREIGDFGNSRLVYPFVIKDYGFNGIAVRREKGKPAPTVESFANEHPTGTFILVLANHLTAVVDGVCYDCWYPQGKTVYKYFEKM